MIIIMKKYVLLFILLSGCTAIEKVSEIDINKNFPHNEIQKISVIMFETSPQDKEKNKPDFSGSIISPEAGNILADITARELAKWERYVVLGRRALEKDIKLKNLSQEDISNTGNYLSLGKSLGVDAVVVGKVERFGISYKTLLSGLTVSLRNRVSFVARCIDVTTNETVWTIKIKGSSRMDNERVLASKLVAEAIKTLKTKLN
ncbi:MAG: hypothetical protein SCARUB_02181 [Candidatus Scalindua rubra]|uniref:Curli production assembly/transport component CsgG n=1 Tax=Candidatus Scalindua rubra TaxID=1872076 RepID=A0A1E3XAM4_9BACT|nr:MAG: hypothetical protein SCARUB_02181 [Candidatus Scalindua rubra]